MVPGPVDNTGIYTLSLKKGADQREFIQINSVTLMSKALLYGHSTFFFKAFSLSRFEWLVYYFTLRYITCHLADAFIQSDLQ